MNERAPGELDGPSATRKRVLTAVSNGNVNGKSVVQSDGLTAIPTRSFQGPAGLAYTS